MKIKRGPISENQAMADLGQMERKIHINMQFVMLLNGMQTAFDLYKTNKP